MLRANTIIAATDFSEGATCAVERAASLAEEHGCALTLVHVFNDSVWQSIERPFVDQRLAVTQERLRVLGTRIQDEYQVTHVESKVFCGKASREIVALLDRDPAELVVVGAHREHRLGNMLVGGTALKVLRGARRPVLMVCRAPGQRYGIALIATDFSNASAHAIRLASDAFPGAAHHLLHAYDASFEDLMRQEGVEARDIARHRQSVEAKAAKTLEDFATQCNALEMARDVVSGDPGAVILDQAKTLPADVILIGKHGGSAVEQRLFGSVTQNVLYHATCDVLVVP